MKNIKSTLSLLIINGLLLTACSANIPITQNVSSYSSNVSSDSTNFSSANNTQSSVTSLNSASHLAQSTSEETSKAKEFATIEQNIAQNTKNYLLNGQQDKSEADKLKWSETFLNKVNIEAVYEKYISAGGKADDIKSFAEYLTENAPVPDNWKDLFAADLLNKYGVKVSRYVPLQNNLYQIYVKINGKEVPYVAVNARTGYFHG